MAIGCFTCRVRRKKCDETPGHCRACRHLGLACEYKRPMWWGDQQLRSAHKQKIKNIIKRTKTAEKPAHGSMGGDTPPGLSYSVPTSATYTVTPRTRAPSIDSQYSPGYDFNQPPLLHDHLDIYGQPHIHSPPYDTNPPYQGYYPTPYEVDIKTERQMYVNDVPTRKDSTISTFSTYQPPPDHTSMATPFVEDAWVHEGIFGNEDIYGAEQEQNFNFGDFGYDQPLTSQSVQVDVDDNDRPLLDHFMENVMKLVLPVLEANRPGSAKSEMIFSALETNRPYLHCCLSVAANHIKSARRIQSEQVDNDIMTHRVALVSDICEAMNNDPDYEKILEATLAQIFMEFSVGRPDDTLPNLPWHQHFEAVGKLVKQLELPHAMEQVAGRAPLPPFSMTLTTWIDILGATMLGQNPQFAHTYREKNVHHSTSGLCDLMGCEDRVMYMISEIACLDALRINGLDDYKLCDMIALLGKHLDKTESGQIIEYASTHTGHIRPRQLCINITEMYRLAARIYLCGMVPNQTKNDRSLTGLIEKLAIVLEHIPAGPEGFDRSLVWPLLIGGALSTPSSSFRIVLARRIAELGEHAEYGSFGRMVQVLQEVWYQSDDQEEGQSVPWRDVMRQKGWDYLLI